jgi:hypothetical protein
MAFENISDAAVQALQAQPTLPQPGANADLTNPSAPDLQSNVGVTALNPLQTPQPQPPTPLTFAEKLHAAANKLGIAPGPGGWARSLVGAGLEALGPTSKAIQSVGASLGDTAAIGTVPAGGGALTGIGRTLGARNQRQQQQQMQASEIDKNKALMAQANVQMMKEQRLIHNMDEEAKQTSLTNGKAQLDAMTASGQEFNVIAKDLTYDKIPDFLKNNGIDPTKETAVPTGIKTIGQDKDGKPITALTYTLTQVPESITLDSENSKQKGALDLLNKYNPPSGGGKWDGTTMTGVQYNLLMQQAHNKVASQLAADRAALAAGFQETEIKKGKEALDFGQDPNVLNALAHATNQNGVPDFISARNALLAASQNKNSPLYGKYQNIDNDMRQALGYTENSKGDRTYVYDKMIEDYQKKADAGVEQLADYKKELNNADGEKAASIAAGLDAKIKDPNTPPSLKPQYQRMYDQAIAQRDASLKYSEDKKARETAAENAAISGDIGPLTDMVLSYEYEPNDLFSRLKGKKQLDDFLTNIHKTDPTWSQAKYKQRYSMQQELASDKLNSMGGQVDSLNRFAFHTASANRAIQDLRNLGSPIIDTPINKIKAGTVGFPEAQSFMIKAETAKDEYLNFIKNGHVPPTEQEERLAAAVNRDRTPAELQDTFRAMAELVAGRAKGMNGRYSTIMDGGSIPGLLQPDTENILRQFGVDTQAIYNTTGITSTSSDINKSPAQKEADRKSLPPVAQGMARVKLPSGNMMDFPAGSDQYKKAIAAGAVAQ